MLKFAILTYGASGYHVKPTEDLPLPAEFDFANPEACAKLIFAVMSNASGGHTLRDCKVGVHLARRTANLTCNGAHVYYTPADLQQPMTLEEAQQAHTERVVYELGSVVTDQYGDGWKRAVWTVA